MNRLLAADPWRRSRLHDMRGNFVGATPALAQLPRVLVGAVVREAMHRYPPLPWIPYPAIRALDDLARPSWRVLEHGAGMSTIWWAERVQHVHAIEASPEWYERIRAELDRRGLANVELELRTHDDYGDLSDIGDATYDLVSVDGHDRELVAPQALRIAKRPGFVYLDNTDFAVQWPEAYGVAEEVLLEAAEEEGGDVAYFTGLAPATVVASQGLLVAFG